MVKMVPCFKLEIFERSCTFVQEMGHLKERNDILLKCENLYHHSYVSLKKFVTLD